MKQKLTKEKALKLHRQMWEDMQKELGDNPSYFERLDFKHEWCKKHGFVDVFMHHAFYANIAYSIIQFAV